VVATVDRTEELERLLQSLERQTHPGFRILLVDQNDDDRLSPILARHLALNVERLETKRGLSRARNAALPLIDAELVAFPDDDCVYPSDLLERVAARFTADPSLGGITGRPIDEHGGSSRTWPLEAADITRHNLWHRSISFTIFLRAAAVALWAYLPETAPQILAAASGGIFRDLHIHDFDSLRWVTGREAAEVYAVDVVRQYRWFEEYGDFDTAAALVRMDDGVLVVLTGGRRDRAGSPRHDGSRRAAAGGVRHQGAPGPEPGHRGVRQPGACRDLPPR